MLWVVLLAVLILTPIVWAVVQSIRHPSSALDSDEGLKAETRLQREEDLRDMHDFTGGFR